MFNAGQLIKKKESGIKELSFCLKLYNDENNILPSFIKVEFYSFSEDRVFVFSYQSI